MSRSKVEGQHRLLVCDGHDSHISGSFIAHCLQDRIVLLILPPHISHILQPSDVAIFGPLKKRLTANLSYLNQAQLARIQKFEWLEAYIKARKEVFDQSHIKSAWRGAGLIPFNRVRVLRSIDGAPSPEPERPKTPTNFDIFDQVFVNSSTPNAVTLREANKLLNSTIATCEIPSTPVRQYIQKLTAGSEQLHASSIIHQHDANNLRSIIMQRKARSTGKRAILQGKFHISTQELCNAVVQAEKATSKQKEKKGKKYANDTADKVENTEKVREGKDEFEDEIGECIIIDVD